MTETTRCANCEAVIRMGDGRWISYGNATAWCIGDANAGEHRPRMDAFTAQHLVAYANSALFDDERDEFVAWVHALDASDLDYYTRSDGPGWPGARDAWYREQTHETTAPRGWADVRDNYMSATNEEIARALGE